MNKLIFASLLSVGAILAAQTPATSAPAADSKTQSPASTPAKVAKVKKTSKKHHKKTTAVNSTTVKPAAK